MSELATTNQKTGFRLGLMTSACALALLAASAAIEGAEAEDVEQPTVWIELGGQLERISGTGDRIIAPFMSLTPTPDPYKSASPADAVRPPRYALGGEGKISFEPEGSNWIFTAAIRYGRSNGNKTAKQQTNHLQYACINATVCNPTPVSFSAPSFAKTFAKFHESHSVLDFSAGKDVGLGMFGRGSVNAGVRYAQFAIKSSVAVYAVPNVHLSNAAPPFLLKYYPDLYVPGNSFNAYQLHARSERNFHGIGPSLSVSASTPIVGKSDGGSFSFDWGANAAILFGRQKMSALHQTSANHYHQCFNFCPRTTAPLYPLRSHSTARTRSVTVPNVGGFAAISLNFPNAKVSLGYRGDFFFGANDAGIDARKEDALSFHGPYATISVGLGG